jgi:hypothetical protein
LLGRRVPAKNINPDKTAIDGMNNLHILLGLTFHAKKAKHAWTISARNTKKMAG